MIDWPALEQRFSGRNDFIAKLLRSTLDHYRDAPSRLELGIANADLDSIGQIAHGLKSTGGNLMAARVQSIAQQTDAAIRRHDDASLELARLLRDALLALLDEAEQRLRTMDTGERLP